MQIGEMVWLSIWEIVAKAIGLGAPPAVHAALTVLEVSFKGNHKIDKDTLGDFGTPEWVLGRAEQFPVCYTRGKKIKLTVKFKVVTKPTASETVAIKGTARLGGVDMEWTGSVKVAPGDTEVTTAEMTASAALADQVDCFEPAQITWEAQPPGQSFAGAGSSVNVIYVVLADPSGTKAFWTLLHISCINARGATTEQELVEKTFKTFPGRNLTRQRDSKALTYWNPDTTRATNTQLLLASSDGSGQCGSWSHFLLDMYQVHGVTKGEKVLVVRTKADHINSTSGFLVKNWTFIGTGSLPKPFTHVMFTECKDEDGIPGQNNANPPPAFFNHFIVKAFGNFYDPSYGGGPVTSQKDWENGAIDGLFKAGACGFPKQAATLLLQFWNALTGARL
jgi:hypothetical protein